MREEGVEVRREARIGVGVEEHNAVVEDGDGSVVGVV